MLCGLDLWWAMRRGSRDIAESLAIPATETW